jgi:hypothetical protein
MNLLRHLGVLWRGRGILAIGIVVAIAMAVLAVFKVSVDGGPSLKWRKPETWADSTKLLITQPGFPWGRSVLGTEGDAGSDASALGQADASATTGKDADGKAVQFADPSRFSYLAWIYSHFLMGDEVRHSLGTLPKDAEILASPLTAGGNLSAGALPIIGLTTQAQSQAEAIQLNQGATAALETYLRQQQDQTKTPTSDRVVVSVVDHPPAALVKGHSPDLGVIAFILVMAAAVSVVYLRENIRVHRRLEAEAAEDPTALPLVDFPVVERSVGYHGGGGAFDEAAVPRRTRSTAS